jgi:hypothetical protein
MEEGYALESSSEKLTIFPPTIYPAGFPPNRHLPVDLFLTILSHPSHTTQYKQVGDQVAV